MNIMNKKHKGVETVKLGKVLLFIEHEIKNKTELNNERQNQELVSQLSELKEMELNIKTELNQRHANE